MWPFSKKKNILQSGLLEGLTDYHSHVLPGVDDGFRTIAESIAALHAYEEHGVAELWLTPHIMEDYPNTTQELRTHFARLKDSYLAEAGPNPVKIHLAAEYMLDTLFAKRLAERDLLTLGDNSLLVETSYFNPPADLHNMLSDIASAGYTPVLAHPERYMYMDYDDYDMLHDSNIHFQLNIVSLAGAYGPEVAKRAIRMLDKDYYHLAGCDMHSLRATMRMLSIPLKSTVVDKLAYLINKQNQNT